ncbi:DUF5717 family protein [Lachnotalea glycerini]|uniref:DUF5717 domain-containing protein n=1 Tax=Lachnotalea glycerini TaxID=1763509 RepID=A0A371JHZ1_9FIRM|nr:DUF5717 family protein [Lachnotalea glycerini]RDY32349.1 hypothetical protein CG710_005045 [Lachnotalea glycerini]
MRERVEELERGDFKSNTPKIEISTPLIEITLNADDCYDGSFTLISTNSYKMKGVVYTSTYRMQCINSQFIGKEATIQFLFLSKGICEGEAIKGNFYIISNGGEFSLPFIVNIQKKVILSSMGKINNLFHFTNLAALNWNEAFEVFQLPEFRNIFINHDKRYENLYIALTAGEVMTEQCMEEFLIGIHKKNPISIQINEQEKNFVPLTGDEKESITITKSTWGYVKIKIHADSEFIELHDNILTTDDFIGSSYPLEYIIRKDKLHSGRNFGRIIFNTINCNIVYHVTVSAEDEKELWKKRKKARMRKKCLVELTKLYTAFRCKKTNTNPWVKDCMEYVNELIDSEEDNKVYKLLKAQLLFIEKKNYDAYELLKEFEQNKKDIKEDIRRYVYYLYLTTFWNKDKKYLSKITDEVRNIYNKKQKSWEILWVLLCMDTTLQADTLQKFSKIEEQYYLGGESPIIYVEAYRLMQAELFILAKLDRFELQVLWWAAKNQVLSREVLLQTANLSAKAKEFNHILYKILIYGYEKYQDKEILGAICGLLIKGNKTEAKYFKWYSLGVEQDVRITRLYEYYMYAIPMHNTENIPKPVLMYFGYYNNLEYKKSALLYERVIKQRDVYPELFQSYRRHIEEFMLEQLMLKRNNEQLAFIYDTMLSLNQMTKEIANKISGILFGCELYCKNPNIKSVLVVHKHLKTEKIYPVIDNTAYINLYTKEYEIALLDREGNRYLNSIEYELKNLIDEAYYIKRCYELDTEDINIKFNICQNLVASSNITDKCLEIISELIDESFIKDSYKNYLRSIVIQYCYDHYEDDNLTIYMKDMNLACVAGFQRSKAIEYLIMKGFYEKAYEEIQKYGCEQIKVKQLVKLISRLIDINDYEENAILLSMCVYVFQARKYDDTILNYLVQYFNGTSNKMKDIWIAAFKFDLDAYELSERLILQVLFTNEYIEEIDKIFEYYYIKGARFQIEKAFLTYYAYRYLVFNKTVGDKIFEYIAKEQQNEDLQNDTCKLALLKHFAQDSVLTEKNKEYVMKTLQEFMHRKMYFKFYNQFEKQILETCCYEGQYIVEYQADSNNKVQIHYFREDLKGEGEYKIEEMKQIYPGIYSKQFTAFYGERIQYYMTEENNTDHLVKNHVIVKNEMDLCSTQSRYNMLNDMSVAMQLNDDQTLLELMKRYAYNSQTVELLFKSI